MLEYQLPIVSAKALEAFAALDEFTQGFVEAAFWLFDDDADHAPAFDELPDHELADVVLDCAAFQATNAPTLAAAYAVPGVDYTPRQAGIDYWLTRNGHGAGYWDRGLGDSGAALATAAAGAASVDLYRLNGELYFVEG